MMDIKKLLDDLDLIEQAIPDYSAGRRKGLTDSETEKIANEAIEKAIKVIEELENQNEVLATTVDMLSPLMMERLTGRMDNGASYVRSETGKEGVGHFTTQRRLPELISRLARYEDAEEEGRLVVLPVKIGDKLYEPELDDRGQATGFTVLIHTNMGTYNMKDFGKTVLRISED